MGKALILYLALLLFLVNAISSSASTYENCQATRELEKHCGSYCYGVVKPLLDYIRKMRSELDKIELMDKEIRDLKEKLVHQESNEAAIREFKKTQNEDRRNIEFLQRTIDGLNINFKQTFNCDKLRDESVSSSIQLGICEYKLSQLNASVIQGDSVVSSTNEKTQNKSGELETIRVQLKDIEIEKVEAVTKEESETGSVKEVRLGENDNYVLKHNNDLKLCQTGVSECNSCIPYGHLPGVHLIQLADMKPFDALCDNQTAGPGWMVIQQHMNKEADFNKGWETYRNGFGSFESDFFLGLEKIYRLTKSQRYELYVYLEFTNGEVKHARYNDFKIAGENEDYTLSRLGTFTGNTLTDSLSFHRDQKFTTYDRDNDTYKGRNCAKYYMGGWWFLDCGYCNLNGDLRLLYWDGPLRKTKMLIRPLL